MSARPARKFALTAAIAIAMASAATAASQAAAGDTQLRDKILAAFAAIKSYKLTVLGSVRSTGVFVAPNKYEMTTDLSGQPVKTVIIGTTYWVYDSGKWQKSGSTGSSLDADIAGLLQRVKHDKSATFQRLPDAVVNGTKVGTFRYSSSGSEETCNFDLQTYRVTRCQREELTILYSGFNDPSNAVAKVH